MTVTDQQISFRSSEHIHLSSGAVTIEAFYCGPENIERNLLGERVYEISNSIIGKRSEGIKLTGGSIVASATGIPAGVVCGACCAPGMGPMVVGGISGFVPGLVCLALGVFSWEGSKSKTQKFTNEKKAELLPAAKQEANRRIASICHLAPPQHLSMTKENDIQPDEKAALLS